MNTEPATKKRKKKKWPIPVAALAGALLPGLIQAGLLGPHVAQVVLDVCRGLPLADLAARQFVW